MITKGITKETLVSLKNGGINVESWLHGFESVEESIKESVSMIKSHPLLPQDVKVHGLIIDLETGEIDIVINGDK